ncbi:MAG: hypothetical protein ACI9T7_003539 [Oleiphilaceae bacterium]|jgi:hypothetical protein
MMWFLSRLWSRRIAASIALLVDEALAHEVIPQLLPWMAWSRAGPIHLKDRRKR